MHTTSVNEGLSVLRKISLWCAPVAQLVEHRPIYRCPAESQGSSLLLRVFALPPILSRAPPRGDPTKGPHDLFYSFIIFFLSFWFHSTSTKGMINRQCGNSFVCYGHSQVRTVRSESLECSRRLCRSVCALCLCGGTLTKRGTTFSSRFDSRAAAGWALGAGETCWDVRRMRTKKCR